MVGWAAVAVLTFLLGSFFQAWLHVILGHRPWGGPLYVNHVTCHHTLYSGSTMTTPRYLDEAKSNTTFYLVPAFATIAVGFYLMPVGFFIACAVGMGFAFVTLVYVHVQFHLISSPLQRFHGFLRLQRLHVVHHKDMGKNHSLLFPFWDRLFGTYQSAEALSSSPKVIPQGPRSALFSGNLPDLQGDKLAFALRSDRELGGIAQYRLWNQPFFLVSDADLISEVLITKHRNFTKPMPLKALDAVFGRGLLTSENDLWVHQRRIMQPAFHRSRLESYASIAGAHASAVVAGWEDGSRHDLYREMSELCLEVFTRSLLGETLNEQKAVLMECVAALQECNRKFTCLPREKLPFAATRRLWRACESVDELVYGLIASRRRAPQAGDDLLSVLLRAQNDDNPALTDRQVRDEVVTMFLGGHETIASGIAWTLYLVSQTPEAARKVEAEVDAVLQGRAPGMEDVSRLEFTGKVIKESYRLFPPAYQIGRVAIEDCDIGGHRIPAKSHVLMYQWAVHRSPRYFERPDEFWPERWTPQMVSSLPRFAYFPFGGGPRTCIGASFSTVETTIVLATLVANFQLELAPGAQVAPDPALTLPLRGNSLPMIVRRRFPARAAAESFHTAAR